jgi:hypothetical protein
MLIVFIFLVTERSLLQILTGKILCLTIKSKRQMLLHEFKRIERGDGNLIFRQILYFAFVMIECYLSSDKNSVPCLIGWKLSLVQKSWISGQHEVLFHLKTCSSSHCKFKCPVTELCLC